jgi:hypothetical protein
MLRYRIEIQDAGKPMPAASTSMSMSSYAGCTNVVMSSAIFAIHVGCHLVFLKNPFVVEIRSCSMHISAGDHVAFA